MPASYCLTALLRVKHGIDIETVRRELAQLCRETRNEQGCHDFVCHQSLDEADTFLLWERFADEAAFHHHFTLPHTQTYLAQNLTEVVQHWASRPLPLADRLPARADRYQAGWQKLTEIDGAQGQQLVDALADIAPDLGRHIIEFAFGDIYSRPHLDNRQRELITLAALTAQGGCEKQLQVHLHAALNVGLSREEIIESLMQCVPYLGFPKVLNAVFVAKTVFQTAPA